MPAKANSHGAERELTFMFSKTASEAAKEIASMSTSTAKHLAGHDDTSLASRPCG